VVAFAKVANKFRNKSGCVLQRKGQVGRLEQWDSLIGNLYESVLNPDSLLSALGGIDQWIGSSFCHILTWDDLNNCAKLNRVTSDVIAHDALSKYESYYGNIDPRRHLSLRQPVGTFWACHDHFDEKFVGKSEFYQDLLIPSGARYILAAYVAKENGLSTYLVFNHLKEQGLFSDQQRQAANRLIPHLQRTIRLSFRNEQFRGGLIAGEAGLNALEQAVFTINVSERVVFSNSAAQALLRQNRWIKYRDGQLMTVASHEADKLRSAILRVRLSRLPESFALSGADSPHGDPAGTQIVTILPVPRADDSAIASATGLMRSNTENTLLSRGEAELVVLIAPQQRKSAMSAAALKTLFRLTPAEARLAHELAKGTTVEDYADSAAVSVATVRTQLRSLLAKTGEKRLQDLVRMLATLPIKG
jgi:DNA-binding CsgD family transcriptional regulator